MDNKIKIDPKELEELATAYGLRIASKKSTY